MQMSNHEVNVSQRPFEADKQAMLEKAWARIDRERLRELLCAMVDIPSPTGEERRLAEFVSAHMADAGLEACCQPLDDTQANAEGRLRGVGDGPTLLLYAPLDTDFTGNVEEDCPGVGAELPPELTPKAISSGDYVVGLGAVNPKGFAACVITAAEAIQRAGLPLYGDLIVGLGAGGMPTNQSPTSASPKWNVGQGRGCSFMLEQGIFTDYAIIAKPGWAVAWEEVGLCWFKVNVKGTLGYVGSRLSAGYDNAILHAATVVREIEDWFPTYAERNKSGLVKPQGTVGAIEGGWPHKPSFIPASCVLHVDLRISPRTAPIEAKRQFAEALNEIQARHPEIRIEWDMILSIPGSHTDPQSWIVQSCMRGWEALEGRPHFPIANTSGATDANILRNRGIPTARLGLPRAEAGTSALMRRGASLASMERLIKCLIYGAIDTCGRRYHEIGA